MLKLTKTDKQHHVPHLDRRLDSVLVLVEKQYLNQSFWCCFGNKQHTLRLVYIKTGDATTNKIQLFSVLIQQISGNIR